MNEESKYREYATSCIRLAEKMPEHRDALLQIAEAWIGLAKELERKRTSGKDPSST
jgi:hypothetical protein